ncbi:hypothetical protein KM043_010823 [Ampulex compressa]|nr:hypothetical protein KM043_010823 [Ampulex compressa]
MKSERLSECQRRHKSPMHYANSNKYLRITQYRNWDALRGTSLGSGPAKRDFPQLQPARIRLAAGKPVKLLGICCGDSRDLRSYRFDGRMSIESFKCTADFRGTPVKLTPGSNFNAKPPGPTCQHSSDVDLHLGSALTKELFLHHRERSRPMERLGNLGDPRVLRSIKSGLKIASIWNFKHQTCDRIG